MLEHKNINLCSIVIQVRIIKNLCFLSIVPRIIYIQNRS
ncbi:hypothetical protein A1OE_46 [Candidatus Endolissoclinum faulkneri L2]|uniref:Uncharacterized protein n=1 Tax=Candidatus Endolissoclinum faulkneri L2 TaxID=1193729 RepID=K7YFA1_9PROT|nr:hypothetical protein A1OE_46 [Candidatus Endolissoclinum faulkneri L2]